jgi:cyclase
MKSPRLIFTLLFDGSSFMMSRNFRLQRVGGVEWLTRNYRFASVSEAIDELMILDVSRGVRDRAAFLDAVREVSRGSFVPLSLGGGITDVEDALLLLRSGADKVVINTALWRHPGLIEQVARIAGEQAIVASVDIRGGCESPEVVIANGSTPVGSDTGDLLRRVGHLPFGELMLTSIDRDGTGMGLDMGPLELLDSSFSHPVILAGGVGKGEHIADGLVDPRVTAVATANLLNFVGDGLARAREDVRSRGLDLCVHLPAQSVAALSGNFESEPT